MKKGILGAAFLLLFFLLQSTLFKYWAIGNVSPNLLIILVCTFGFMYGEREGLIMGFFAGLLCDIFFGSYLGINAIIYMYIGYVNGKFNRLFFPEDILLPGTLFLTSDFFYNFIYYILMFLLRSRFNIGYYFMNLILPETIYTIVCSIVFYPALLFSIKKLKEIEKRSPGNFV